MTQLHLLAYLDPATGSLILQGIIAGICAVLFVVKICWHSIKSFILNLIGRAPSVEDSAPKDHSENDDDDDKNSRIVS